MSSGALSDLNSSGTPREKMMRFMIAWHTRSIFRWEKFQHGFSREQIHHDQYFSIVHAVEVNPVSLPRQEQFLLRSWVEVQIQLPPSSVCPYALGAGGADCLNSGIHSWPVIERVKNVMHFGGCDPDDGSQRVCS